MDLNSKLAETLLQARKQRGWSQEEVAEAVYISTRWYQNIEKGKSIPSGLVLLRLFSLLNIEISTFCQVIDLNTEALIFKNYA